MNEQDQRVRDYYEKLSLPHERLERLINIESHEVKESTSNGLLTQLSTLRARLQSSNSKYWNTAMGLAAVCFVVLTLSYFFSAGHYLNEHTERTVREVAMNHTTRLDPEFRGENLAMLDNSMQQLPFSRPPLKESTLNYGAKADYFSH